MEYLIGAAILVIVAFVLLARRGKTFPPKGHRIFLKEADISCNALIEGIGKVCLVGRPDLVTVDATDMLHVYEYKTRKNETIYLADKIQLALYKFILERTRDMRVSNVGHIVFLKNGQREKVVPVALATVDIPAHVATYVRDTRKDPGCTMNGKCWHCHFQNDCRTNC
jgi:CRISPR/Cas system-associated exonuclease Cas4 (RecB family)